MAKQIKEYWSTSPKWARILFWVFLGFSTCLIVGSFFIPPMGSVDISVLKAIGEIMGFASFGVGIECIFAGFEVTLSKGDMSINVIHDNNCECKVK